VNVWGTKKWAGGSLTNPDAGIRREAIEEIKKGMDSSKIVGANKINLWLGQDGHNYPFQTDYEQMWTRIVDGVGECARHDGSVRIALEYKLKEPRTHIAVGTVCKALYVIDKIGLPNVGVNLDVGHAVQCYENPSESAILLNREKRLFHLHFNDNYGEWDWDMTTGSCHFWETLELCFWLDEIGWNDYYSFDIFPSTDDPVKMVKRNIDTLRGMFGVIEKLDRKNLLSLLEKRDYPAASQLLTSMIL
jgi:xylose isomerase